MYNGHLHSTGTTIIQFLPVLSPNKPLEYSFVSLFELFPLNIYHFSPITNPAKITKLGESFILSRDGPAKVLNKTEIKKKLYNTTHYGRMAASPLSSNAMHLHVHPNFT